MNICIRIMIFCEYNVKVKAVKSNFLKKSGIIWMVDLWCVRFDFVPTTMEC